MVGHLARISLALTFLGCSEIAAETIIESGAESDDVCVGPEAWITVENQTDQPVAFTYWGVICAEDDDEEEAFLEPGERSRFGGWKGDKVFGEVFSITVEFSGDSVRRVFNAGEAIALKWHGTLLAPALLCPGLEGYLERKVSIENRTEQRLRFYLDGNCSGSHQWELEPHEERRFGEGDDWFEITVSSGGGSVTRRLGYDESYVLQWRGDLLDIFTKD